MFLTAQIHYNLIGHHATQGSTHTTVHGEVKYAYLAIDGNASPNADAVGAGCAHTLSWPNQWWSVDMKISRKVYSVTITERGMFSIIL